jgi:hypothetical protein
MRQWPLMSDPMDRDFEVEPYNADEHRVAIWFADHGIGGGDDPIGSMIACLEYRNVELAATRTEIERLRAALVEIERICWIEGSSFEKRLLKIRMVASKANAIEQ